MPINTQVVVPAQVKLPGSSLSADEVTTALAGATVQLTAIELGHATDTTLARSAAGQMTVEGVQVLTSSNTVTVTNKSIDGGQLTGTVVDARLPSSVTFDAIGTRTAATLAVSGVKNLQFGATSGNTIPGSGIPSIWSTDTVFFANSASTYTLQSGGITIFRVGASANINANSVACQSGSTFSATSGVSAGSVALGGRSSTDGTDSAATRLHADNHATYPGAHHQFAPLDTRAASTAIALCPVATGDTAKVEISETTIDDCLAFVNAAGSVGLYDKIGGTVNASIVNSSSPAAGEYGVYISAGVLYFKGGSSYAGKMASFSKIGKA